MPKLATPVTVRISDTTDGVPVSIPGTLCAVGDEATTQLALRQTSPGLHLLLSGDRDYYIVIPLPIEAATLAQLRRQVERSVSAVFPGRPEVRRRLSQLVETKLGDGQEYASKEPSATDTPLTDGGTALNLVSGIYGAKPLYLLGDGRLSLTATEPVATDRKSVV